MNEYQIVSLISLLGFLILVAVSLRTQATGLPGKDTAGLDKG